MKKINYAQAIPLYTATVTNPSGAAPVLAAIAGTHGATMTAQVRARRIYEKLDAEIKLFFSQRDAIMTRYAMMFQANGDDIDIVDDPNGTLADGVDADFNTRKAAVEGELASLLAEETEPLPTMPLSALSAAIGPAKALVERPEIVQLLYPLIDDDI